MFKKEKKQLNYNFLTYDVDGDDDKRKYNNYDLLNFFSSIQVAKSVKLFSFFFALKVYFFFLGQTKTNPKSN